MGSKHTGSSGGGGTQPGREPENELDLPSLDRWEQEDEVDEAYNEFVESSRITDRQGERISQRRDVLEEILREEIGVEDSRLIGSFTRDTMTGPLREDSDADVMMVLDARKHREWVEQENGPRKCLNTIKRKIQNDPRFSETEVRVDRNAVKVKYHDSTVEIVPAFRYRDVPGAEHPKENPGLFESANDGYAIPDTYGNQSWVGTNPRQYKQQFEARDQANDGKLSGLTRSMKKWADNNNVPIRSYTMEIMVYNYFKQKAQTGEPVPSSHEATTRDFVESLPDRVQSETREPIYDEQVDRGMSRGDKQKASKEASKLRAKLEEAKRLKEQGETEKAKQKLNEAYGEGFS
jgi:hypothetical protein